MSMDYYSILGVSKTASQDEIKKAYRKLAMKHHPDRGGDAEMSAKINEAYTVLGDPQKREQYDNPQPEFNFRTSGFGNGDPFEDIFAQAFGFGGPRRRQAQNRDVQLQYTLDLEDCFIGRGISIAYQLPSGRHEQVDVQIPPGVKNGDTVQVSGYGDDSNPQLSRGKLILKIRVKNTKNWQVDGVDLHTTKKVSVFDLMLGTNITIDTPDHKSLNLKVPAGSQSGTSFSVTGYGLPHRKTGKHGKLFIKVIGEVPKVTNKETLKKIQEIKNAID